MTKEEEESGRLVWRSENGCYYANPITVREAIRTARAEAWEEGVWAQTLGHTPASVTLTTNPYLPTEKPRT